jgi:hypothetical protein
VNLSDDRARVSIGRPPHLTLTHACPIGASPSVNPPPEWHRFDLVFSNDEFSAAFIFETSIAHLESFHDELVLFNRDLNGYVSMDTVEGELSLRGEVDKRGHILWTGELRYPGGVWKARLEFEFDDDQTSLPKIIRQVHAILAEANDEAKTTTR